MTRNSAFTQVGQGQHNYTVAVQWEQLPPGYEWGEVAAVATDAQNRVFVFNRGLHPVVVLESNGDFLGSWGAGQFVRPHGIAIGPDDSVSILTTTTPTW